MASMTTSTVAAAVPAGLRTELLESSIRSAPSNVLMGHKKMATAQRRTTVVARASSSEESWNVAKSAAAAAALALVLSASPVEAKDGNAFLGFPDNAAGEASRNILGDAKKKADDSFAEAQKTGLETTGQAASAGQAPPAISQVDPNAEEASDSIGDAIAAKADAAADLAPGTGQQNGKKGVNPIEKAFATPTRGLGDKAGENEARAGNLLAKKDDLPGNDQTYRQNTGVSESIYNTFKEAGEGRDIDQGRK
jgi:hypothetical protein